MSEEILVLVLERTKFRERIIPEWTKLVQMGPSPGN